MHTADGVGYGEDGTVWGGEILHYQGAEYERVGSLLSQKMVGGDLTTRYPIRMVMSILYDHYEYDELLDLMKRIIYHISNMDYRKLIW